VVVVGITSFAAEVCAVLRKLAYLYFICIVYPSLFPVVPPSEAGYCLASQETSVSPKFLLSYLFPI
jgi:hypothetical protein